MHIMLAPCIICNSFYLITWSFLPSFSLSPSFLPSPWQTENLAVQKLFLPIIGKVLKHNWKNVVIPVTTVFFSHASDMSTIRLSGMSEMNHHTSCPWTPWQKKKRISHFSHWGLTGYEIQSKFGGSELPVFISCGALYRTTKPTSLR